LLLSFHHFKRYLDFCDFQNCGRRHLGFSKIRNFNGLFPIEGKSASPCQISSKSVKQLRRYGDLTVFKMQPSAILDFGNSNFFNDLGG